MTNQFQINGLQSGENQLTILEGKALETRPPKKLIIDGNINAVSDFLRIRKDNGSIYQEIKSDTVVITVDEDDVTIILSTHPNDEYGTVVTARMNYTEEFKEWGINTTKQFTREALVKLIRFNRRYFDSPEKYESLLKAYMSLQISAQTEVKAASDNRGNKNNLFGKVVNSENIPTEFILVIPVFKGQPAERFRVEICIEVTEGSVRFWFESPELSDMIATRKKEVFDKITSEFPDFVVIRK